MTPIWEIHVLPEIEQRIAALQISLEKPGLSPDRTEFARGEIHALRRLVKLPAELKHRAERQA